MAAKTLRQGDGVCMDNDCLDEDDFEPKPTTPCKVTGCMLRNGHLGAHEIVTSKIERCKLCGGSGWYSPHGGEYGGRKCPECKGLGNAA